MIGLIPADRWVLIGNWVAPGPELRPKTILLLHWLRGAVPWLGLAGIGWLFAPRRWTAQARDLADRILRSGWFLPAVIALNLGLGIAWITGYPTQLYADSIWYFEHAAWMADGYGYVYDLESLAPTAVFPVGYPFALSLFFRLTGASPGAAQAFNLILLAGSVALAHRIGGRLFGPAAASLAALMLATLPGLLVYTSLVNSDLLFLFLSLLAWELVLGSRPDHPVRGLGIGLLIGFSALVRSVGILMLPFWIVTGWIGPGRDLAVPRGTALRWAGAILVGAGLVIGPWIVRNYAAFGKLVPVSNNSGVNFWMGSNPRADGGFVSLFYPGSPFPALSRDEIALDETAFELGWTYFREHPLRVLGLAPAKVFYLLNSNDAGLEWNASSGLTRPQTGSGARAFAAVNLVYTLEMLPAALALGFLLVDRRQAGKVRLGALFVGYWILLHLPFFGKDRFMVPALPFLLLYSAWGLLTVVSNAGAVRQGEDPPCAARVRPPSG